MNLAACNSTQPMRGVWAALVAAFLLARVVTGFCQTAATAAKPSVKGSEIYQQAFTAVTERRCDEALQLIKKLDEKNTAQRAERLAIEAWVELIRCRFDSAEDKA